MFEEYSCRILRRFSHKRNRKTREEIAAASLETAYRRGKAQLAVDLLSPHLTWEGKHILDIGCGNGDLCIALAQSGAERVVGIDLDPVRIECARRNAVAQGVQGRTDFVCMDFARDFSASAAFDIVFSIGAFEHFLDPEGCLRKIAAYLKPGGTLAARFGPLWWTPYGAHMKGFTSIPWVHVFFPERAVLKVREECYRPGQRIARYEDIDGHLNRITVKRFRRVCREVGLRTRVFRLNPEQDRKLGGFLRPLNTLLGYLRGLRELVAFSLFAVLEKPSS